MRIDQSPGRNRLKSWLPALIVSLTALVLLAFAAGPYMHESDQASILKGAVELATGQADAASQAYNYDKQYVSYWLLAAIYRLLPRPINPDHITLGANLAAFIFFWGMFLGCTARFGRRLSVVVLSAIALAPVFLTHSPFFATAFLAAGFLMLTTLLLELKTTDARRKLIRRSAVFAAVFCAVGARADSVLLLPLLVLLHAKGKSVKALLTTTESWTMFAAALLALLLGRLLYRGAPLDFLPPFFRLKIFAAYAVFGLGANVLLLPACVTGLLLGAFRKKARGVHRALLAAALVTPLLYYGSQLTSTRYFVLAVVGLFLFACSRQGAALPRLFLSSRRALVFKIALVAASVVPVFLGVNVSFLDRPRLTWSHPTRFPTADGVLPMGSYLHHAMRLRAADGLVDHNHAVWLAALRTDLQPTEDGAVAVLQTPLSDYLRLAARLQARDVREYSLEDTRAPSRFYVDSRSVMRRNVADLNSMKSETYSTLLASRPLRQVSEVDFDGITILEASNATSSADWNGLILALNAEFKQNEYRLKGEFVFDETHAGYRCLIGDDDAGKTLFLISAGDFQCEVQAPGEQPELCEAREISSPEGRAWFVFQKDRLKPQTSIVFRAASQSKITLSISVFPDWMSFKNL